MTDTKKRNRRIMIAVMAAISSVAIMMLPSSRK
jgi:predicted nucleic acid-binding Zn ribbon protein